MEDQKEIKNLSEVLLLPKNESVVSYTTKQLTEPGENYGSLILAVDVLAENVETKSRSTYNLVAKLCPPNEWIAEVFNIKVTFKKENAFYNVMLPELQRFQREYNVKEIDIFPRYFGSRISLNSSNNIVDGDAVLFLENLKTSGFKTVNCMQGFDLKSTEMIITDLALFHALPVAYKLKKPQEFQCKFMPYLEKNMNLARMSEEIQNGIFNSMVEVVEQSEETKYLSEKVMKTLRHAIEVYKTHEPSGPYQTIVHNDYWVNNTMLKFTEDGETPLKNVMVDFQLMELGSPATDLVFFLHSSVEKSVLHENYDRFLKMYHDTFVSVLKQFDCDTTAFTFELLQQEMKFQGCSVEFFHTLMMLRPIYMDRVKLVQLTEFKDTDMLRMDVLLDTYPKALQDTVLEFEKWYW